jgi:hypothetical protein
VSDVETTPADPATASASAPAPAAEAAAEPTPAAAPAPASASGFAGLPRWLRIALIAAATAVGVLVIAVVIRVVLQTPFIPLGPTPAERVVPGACLLEPGEADQYTVVACSTPHQQQVIAEVDLDFPGVVYTADSALAEYAQQTCDRLLEYQLYLPHDLKRTEYAMAAVRIPSLAEYQAGDTRTLCAVLDNPDVPDEGGASADLVGDLYQPIPG